MRKFKQIFDFSDELILERLGNGVRLVKPPSITFKNSCFQSLAKINDLPLNIYFNDSHSIVQKMNENTALIGGYLSAKDAEGQSIRQVARKDTAQEIIKNDQVAIKQQSLVVSDESYTRLDGVDLTAISFKFPWFNHLGKVIGIFGCSIMIGENASTQLASALSILIQTGLLANPSAPAISMLPGIQVGNTYLDSRDKEILFYLIRGKTAKGIARLLNISYRTVEHRIEKIRAKLNVSSKSELIEKIISLSL